MSYTTLTELHALLFAELNGNPVQTSRLRNRFESLEPLWETVDSLVKRGKPEADKNTKDLIGEDVKRNLGGLEVQTVYGETVSAEDYFYSRKSSSFIYVPGEATPMTRDEVSEVLDRNVQSRAHFYRNNTSKALRFTERSTGEEIKMGRVIELDKEYFDHVSEVGKENAGPHPVKRDFSPNSHYVITGVGDPNKYRCIRVDTNKDGLAYQFTLSKSKASSAATNMDMIKLQF